MALAPDPARGLDPGGPVASAAVAPPPRLRFDRHELSGAFGDIGTDLPLLLAMIPAAGLDAGSVFVLFGLAQVLTGVAYGLPMPMQPLKAMAVIVIAQQISADVLFGAGLAIGAVMLGLTVTGLLQWLVRVIPRCVVRGVQLGLALSLGQLALKQYVPAAGASGFVLAAVCFVILASLLGNRRVPAALPVIGLGVVVALASGIDTAAITAGVGLHLPSPRVPEWTDVVTGFVVLALPQLPLSISNSVIATHRTLADLFPERSVTVRKIGATYGIVNLVLPFLGGVPLCHGCGGLAGHHAFGGRTGGSVAIYGGLFLLIGLFFGGAASEVVRLFPLPLLGVVLLFEAVALGSLVGDIAGSRRELTIALVVALCALGLPQGYVVGLIVGVALYHAGVGLGGIPGTTAPGDGPGCREKDRP
ncbi:putative sulfate/molybdate transporter [Myxococcota bacterium]|nr:putative sulfate/molybdate transporter [Myxococcota bacterium]